MPDLNAPVRLTRNQFDALQSLYYFTRTSPDLWARSRDIGGSTRGSTRSHHASTLVRLVMLGLVDHRDEAHPGTGRARYVYRPSAAGLRALADREATT